MTTTIVKKDAVAKEINSLHLDFLKSMKQNLERAIRIGELLTDKKGLLDHGEFTPWLQENLSFSDRTARSYMKLFRNCALLKTESVSDLTEAYRLLSPQCNTPNERLATILDDLEEPLSRMVSMGHAFREIRDKRLYRERYDTFAEFCEQEFDVSEEDALEYMNMKMPDCDAFASRRAE